MDTKGDAAPTRSHKNTLCSCLPLSSFSCIQFHDIWRQCQNCTVGWPRSSFRCRKVAKVCSWIAQPLDTTPTLCDLYVTTKYIGFQRKSVAWTVHAEPAFVTPKDEDADDTACHCLNGKEKIKVRHQTEVCTKPTLHGTRGLHKNRLKFYFSSAQRQIAKLTFSVVLPQHQSSTQKVFAWRCRVVLIFQILGEVLG